MGNKWLNIVAILSYLAASSMAFRATHLDSKTFSKSHSVLNAKTTPEDKSLGASAKKGTKLKSSSLKSEEKDPLLLRTCRGEVICNSC